MGAASSPVTPSVLGWAIAEDGRSVQELAEALDVAVDDVESWVAGDAAPSRGQVTKIAKALRRPRALFFMPSPPAGAALPASFTPTARGQLENESGTRPAPTAA